jgi:hypothetical protein
MNYAFKQKRTLVRGGSRGIITDQPHDWQRIQLLKRWMERTQNS